MEYCSFKPLITVVRPDKDDSDSTCYTALVRAWPHKLSAYGAALFMPKSGRKIRRRIHNGTYVVCRPNLTNKYTTAIRFAGETGKCAGCGYAVKPKFKYCKKCQYESEF